MKGTYAAYTVHFTTNNLIKDYEIKIRVSKVIKKKWPNSQARERNTYSIL
jgi:hypothetical protein